LFFLIFVERVNESLESKCIPIGIANTFYCSFVCAFLFFCVICFFFFLLVQIGVLIINATLNYLEKKVWITPIGSLVQHRCSVSLFFISLV
jgi:hypothetical protein